LLLLQDRRGDVVLVRDGDRAVVVHRAVDVVAHQADEGQLVRVAGPGAVVVDLGLRVGPLLVAAGAVLAEDQHVAPLLGVEVGALEVVAAAAGEQGAGGDGERAGGDQVSSHGGAPMGGRDLSDMLWARLRDSAVNAPIPQRFRKTMTPPSSASSTV